MECFLEHFNVFFLWFRSYRMVPFSPSTYSTSLHGGFLFLSLIPPRCQSCRVTISDWSIRVSTARLQVLRLKVVVVFHSAKIIKSMPDDITTSDNTDLRKGTNVVGNHFWMPKLSLTNLFWTWHGMRDSMYCFRVWSFPIERFTAHWFLCQHQLKNGINRKSLGQKQFQSHFDLPLADPLSTHFQTPALPLRCPDHFSPRVVSSGAGLEKVSFASPKVLQVPILSYGTLSTYCFPHVCRPLRLTSGSMMVKGDSSCFPGQAISSWSKLASNFLAIQLESSFISTIAYWYIPLF